MRAMAVVDYAQPLQLLEMLPSPPPPDRVRIRVLACGVCFTDLKIARGQMPFSPTLPLPHIPGHEICGEVLEAPEGSGFRRGDRVLVYNYWGCGRCPMCRMGQENLCLHLQGWVGFTTPGGFQEELAVPPERLLPLPLGLSPEQAAPIGCAVATAYRALITRGGIRAGETVGIIGVGGVGIHAVQIARAAGARVLAVDVDPRKLDLARAVGAIEAVTPEAAEAAARSLSAGIGLDAVADTVGHSDTVDLALRLVRRGGRVIGIGYRMGELAPLSIPRWVLEEGILLGSRYALRHEVERAIQLVAQGLVRTVVDAVLPLEAANEALERLARGQTMGRLVLGIAPDRSEG